LNPTRSRVDLERWDQEEKVVSLTVRTGRTVATNSVETVEIVVTEETVTNNVVTVETVRNNTTRRANCFNIISTQFAPRKNIWSEDLKERWNNNDGLGHTHLPEVNTTINLTVGIIIITPFYPASASLPVLVVVVVVVVVGGGKSFLLDGFSDRFLIILVVLHSLFKECLLNYR
jgi:hypothetical protein